MPVKPTKSLIRNPDLSRYSLEIYFASDGKTLDVHPFSEDLFKFYVYNPLQWLYKSVSKSQEKTGLVQPAENFDSRKKKGFGYKSLFPSKTALLNTTNSDALTRVSVTRYINTYIVAGQFDFQERIKLFRLLRHECLGPEPMNNVLSVIFGELNKKYAYGAIEISEYLRNERQKIIDNFIDIIDDRNVSTFLQSRGIASLKDIVSLITLKELSEDMFFCKAYFDREIKTQKCDNNCDNI